MITPLLMEVPAALSKLGAVLLVILGFSAVVFVHELGHFIVAKWAGVRVDKFCVGFGRELFGFTRGGTRYAFNILPLGGYVKMLGQEDFAVDKSGEWTVKDDPDSFTNKPIRTRMVIVSAGVLMNLTFAALAFMVVYMIGLDSLAPVVGFVAPGSPADLAGLQVGDRVVRIDGSPVQGFQDIKMATVLAEPHEPITFEIERNGEVSARRVVPAVSRADGLLWVGIGPGFTNQIAAVSEYVTEPGRPTVKPGDIIAGVNGQPTDSFMSLWQAMLDSRGRPVSVTVSRADPDRPDAPPTEEEAFCRVPFDLQPSTWAGEGSEHFLGFVPRRAVLQVLPGSRAVLAGFKEGDVVVRWEGIGNPTYDEMIRSIRANAERDLRVRVLRDGEFVDLVVRPRRTGGFFKEGKAVVGLSFDGFEERTAAQAGTSGLVIADAWPVVDGERTPVAGLTEPRDDGTEPLVRGAVIEAVDGRPVASWTDLVNRFRDRATEVAAQGDDVGEVRVTYRNPRGESQTRPMRLPISLRTAAGIPDSAVILSIDGEKWVTIRDADGNDREVSVSHWRGAKEMFTRRVGNTVEVTYFCIGESERKRTTYRVTESNVDPWLMRLSGANALLSISPFPITEPIKASNPVMAVWVGIKQTYYIIMNVYTTMQRMIFTRSVGLENMSGPVGIVKMGSDIAESDLNRLLWFLAMISANLAVINFLPLPIVDGGLMVFLIIELIKGQPVSLKTQVVTQVIGLALIIAAFAFVTFMDISKMTSP